MTGLNIYSVTKRKKKQAENLDHNKPKKVKGKSIEKTLTSYQVRYK